MCPTCCGSRRVFATRATATGHEMINGYSPCPNCCPESAAWRRTLAEAVEARRLRGWF